jgi:hypothetical protein
MNGFATLADDVESFKSVSPLPFSHHQKRESAIKPAGETRFGRAFTGVAKPRADRLCAQHAAQTATKF